MESHCLDSHPTEDVLASPVAIAEPCCRSSPPKLEGGMATSAKSSAQWRAGSISMVERDAKGGYDRKKTQVIILHRLPSEYQRRFLIFLVP